MKSRIIFRCSTIVNKLTSVLLGTGLIFSAVSVMADCESSKGIKSNNILGVTGSGDSLWMLSWDEAKSQYLINTIIHDGDTSILNEDKNWGAYTLGCINSGILDLAYGGKKAVLCFDTLKYGQENSILSLTNNGSSIQQQRVDLEWSDFLKDSTEYIFNAIEAVWVNGAFYFACLDGGMVKWDYLNDNRAVFLPGKPSSVPVSDFDGLKDGSNKVIAPDKNKRVIDVKKYGNDVMVVTPAKIWRFSTADSSWDSSISSAIANSDLKFKEFEAVFPSPDGVYYSRICISKEISGKWKDTTILAKYSDTRKYWKSMLDKQVYDVVFGPDGYIFTLDENSINGYRDTLADSLVTKNPVDNKSMFDNWVTRNYTISTPEYTDILYLPLTDSTGYFWVASSDGIFFSQWKTPVKFSADFVQIKRAPAVEAGLEKTYARPGILTNNISGGESRTVFIYNVSKDTKVTIRIYDYNMDLVKTVINNKFRRAGSTGGPYGRSTIENEDWWDGRNSTGKMVAPGVYYYKITTDIGERAFGKIVVAK
ncbi:MAG TPA: hypothetical protein VHO70_08330 [Chitinispirillaceae bacterium]|nr:hypothetical protein [Chitinispirillaceae bacterium]